MSTSDPDALLGRAAIPPLSGRGSDDSAWDELAEAIVAKARAATVLAAAPTDEILAAPALDPEPGEPIVSMTPEISVAATGVEKMSESDRPKASQRRPSLKELAERVSKAPPPPSSSAAPDSASVTPMPVSMSPASLAPGSLAPNSLRALASAVASSPLSTPLPAAPPSLAPSSLAPSSLAPSSLAPGSLAPGSLAPGSLAPGSVAPASVAAAPPTNVVPISAAAKEEKSSGGYAGIVVALVGVAAAAGLFFALRMGDSKKVVSSSEGAKTETAEAADTAAAAAKPPKQEESPSGVSAPKDDTLDINQLGDVPTADPEAPAGVGGPLPAGPTGAVAANEPEGNPAERPVKINPDGTLDDEMKRAAGVDDSQAKQATPAGEAPKGPQNVPDQPPQGSVTAAVGSVMGGAKACVSGADDVSRAVITFGSSGSVQSVSVSGWAGGKPAASCIQAALKGANVGPFSKPTYTFGVTIRP